MTAEGDRLYPARPILAVSLAVFRQGRALIARRARAPLKGLYSLPGGRVEIGETLQEAALRELDEEVGLRAEILAFNDHVEQIVRDSQGVRAHYVIASFVGRWLAGEALTSAEADRVMWIDPIAPISEPTTPGLAAILAKAARLAEAFA
ncbi:MAG TPA: NUDIX domain-containing protein [Roseiarcus sp.]|nr:NUDIX domain-containing protein [Roseiarcus sp.]